jgi:hypothetical protein
MKAQSNYNKISLSKSVSCEMSLNKFVLETNRDITAAILQSYLPSEGSSNLTFCDKKKRWRF